jgi:hypothetical protein
MTNVPKPRTSVTVAGQKLGLQFDMNTNPTKRGIKMQFVLPSENGMDPKEKQELTQKISTALQKRFGDAGVMVDFDDRTPYENVIGFLVPLSSVTNMLMNVLKGQH